MGIVAYCPNDHRVKVKNDLAGKKGICPTCGARFRIPLESQPDRKHAARDIAGPPADLVEADLFESAAPSAASAPIPESVPAPVPTPMLLPAAASARLSATGTPIAEIVSFDATLAASLPRAMPLATQQ